ncbi:MAG TPA: thermonuclease family protein [Candidatus Saccharimonadales bacterium]|nr:thermonuclease family protein [Candidatus Saccharimonadales bacterium]
MSRRRKQTSVVSVIVAVLSLFVWLSQEYGWFANAKQDMVASQPGQYKVVRFSDGDTITVDMNGKNETIRMIGVDTPETHDPRKPVQCYGPAASAFTKNTITAAGSQVRLAGDSLSSNRDRYDRLLRYVYLPDGTLFNERLIREGYGFYYPYFPFTKEKEFEAAQKTAREGNKGIWGNCNPKPTDRGGWVSNDAE